MALPVLFSSTNLSLYGRALHVLLAVVVVAGERVQGLGDGRAASGPLRQAALWEHMSQGQG